MSGIVGLYHADGAPIDGRLLARMTRAMAYRGPDNQQTWNEGDVGFGHTLLKTTWQAEHEQQPCQIDGMCIVADVRLDGRDELIERLESRSERFATRQLSDSELILRGYRTWGEECVCYLIGDFAFAIWDGRADRLFCARDHFGVKPFYYLRKGDTFAFSNTLNCLRLHPAVSDELNELAVADFLLFELNQDPTTTTFADVQRLPPAHTLSVSQGGTQIRRYWTLPFNRHVHRRPDEYVEHFKELFDTSVRERIRTGRVAAMMSGGLDSPSIVATAKRLAHETSSALELHAHTMVYDRLMPDDERHFSGMVARYLDVPIHYLPIDDYQLFGRWDQPESARPEPTPGALELMERDLFARMAATARVAFSGDGGDAVQCPPQGYLADLLRKGRVGTVARSAIHIWRTTGRIPRIGIRYTIRHMFGLPRREGLPYPEWLNPDFERTHRLRERWHYWDDIAFGGSELGSRSEARAFLNQPYWTSLFEMQNVGGTREAVEVRYPFFDIRLLDFMLGIPPIPWCVEKNILRVAMKGRLPEAVRLRPKTPMASDGFSERRTQIRYAQLGLSRELDRFVDVCKLAKTEFAPATPFGQALGALSLDWWLRQFRALPRLQEGTT